MRKYFCFIVALFAFVNIANAQKTLTTDDYNRAVNNLGGNLAKLVDRAGVTPNWQDDGNFWYKVNTATGTEYVFVNTKTGVKKTGATRDEVIKNPIPATPISTNFIGTTSPDGTKEAFIKNYNLWMKEISTKKETQLTFDGEKNFGYATDNAGWTHSGRAVLLWSPDSKKIATFKLDERHVKDMYLVKTNIGAPVLSQWKYPLPGDSAIQKIHRVIINVENATVVKFKTSADDHRSTLCDDISCAGGFDDNEWSADGTKLAFVSTPRDHKKATLRVVDAATGDVRDVLKETVATQYESGWSSANWRYLSASNEFIWFSEKTNWGHLYLYDGATGKLKNQITTGNFVVTEILKVDVKKKVIYFEGRGKEAGRNPMQLTKVQAL